MCKLRETESRHRESASPLFPLLVSHPHHPNFLGALSISHGEPQTRSTFAPLTIEGVHPPARRGLGARFRSLDRRADFDHCTQTLRCWLDAWQRGEMGGRTRSAERQNNKTSCVLKATRCDKRLDRTLCNADQVM